MRIRTAFAVALVSGLACLGVPTIAAADELPPTPPEPSSVTAPAEDPVAEPTPEPTDVPTSEVSEPEPEDTAAPTEEPAEPSAEETAVTAEGTTGEPTDSADPTPPAEEPGGLQAVEDGEVTGEAESGAPIGTPATAEAEALPLSSPAIAEPVLDPRAHFGDPDCTDLTVPVTLDNSRSTHAVWWMLNAYRMRGEEAHLYYREAFVVAAAATETVRISVTDGSVVLLEAWVETREVGNVAGFSSLKIACTGDGPRSSIGDVDCRASTVPVTLDNSRSLSETDFWVTTERWYPPGEGSGSREQFAMPAGETRVVQVGLAEGTPWDVRVQIGDGDADEGTLLAWEHLRVFCGARQLTTAAVGDFDCSTRTVLVTLDNSEAVDRRAFELQVYAESEHFGFEEFYDLRPGAIRLVGVRVPAANRSKALDVRVFDIHPQTTLGQLLADRVIRINCPRTAARPTVAVQGAKLPQAGGVTRLPQTGGVNLALPLLGVALLAGGAGMVALTGRRPGRVIGCA